jgi:hypothetical protein
VHRLRLPLSLRMDCTSPPGSSGISGLYRDAEGDHLIQTALNSGSEPVLPLASGQDIGRKHTIRHGVRYDAIG